MPTEDEALVARLRVAGGIIVGKTNTPEFGSGTVTNNLVFGPTLNPFDLERTSEDSSGGARRRSNISRYVKGVIQAAAFEIQQPGAALLGFVQRRVLFLKKIEH